MKPIHNPAPRRTALRTINILLVAGLVLLLFGLPFHLVIKRLIPDPIGTYWKEGLLGLLVLLWSTQCLLERRLLLTGTPLDGAVLAFLGLLVLRFVLDRSGWVGMWGLYISVLYLPLYWLIPSALRYVPRASSSHPGPSQPEPYSRMLGLIALLVAVGAILALGGLAEFLLDRSLWPSVEITQRLGQPDFYIYGTHVRRVYFTLDSPTTLANTLAMLLPLAFSLALAPASVMSQHEMRHWVWARIASGAAALLMTACIIVTFSRGIWFATALSLPGIAFSGLIQRPKSAGWIRARWRLLLGVTAGLLVIGLIWGIAVLARAPKREPPPWEKGVVELSPEAYATAPVIEIHHKLLQNIPASGQAIRQTWTLLDPIAGRQDTRTVILAHPPEEGKAEQIYRVQVPQSGYLQPALRFAIALSPEVWTPGKGDGTSFEIYLADIEGSEQGQFVFVRYINPKHNPSDRRWRSFVVDLSPWAGHTVDLSLITSAGPAGDWAFDWSGWAHPQVVMVEPGLFIGRDQAGGPLRRHARSMLDWARDETNRDRLAAWNLSWAAWRAAPLWGQGLGTTGVAALRTHPERAFVTESQVLKASVELGVPGLLALFFLWFQIARVGYRTYQAFGQHTAWRLGAPTAGGRLLLTGILTSLAIVFLEGWVYQNLEVKQVNAYFWTLVGLLGFLAHRPESQ